MNEYRDAMAEYRLSWLEREYEQLLDAGRVSAVIAKWIDSEGGIRGMKESSLDSFGDLISRTKEKLRAGGE